MTEGEPAAGRGKLTPRQLWAENFGRGDEQAARADGDDERHEAGRPRGEAEGDDNDQPRRVADVGEEAYRVGGRVSGTLYALKGERFLRVSLGGPDEDAARRQKVRAVAQKALARL